MAVVGDGSLTGGMAYEALNNLGHSNQRVVIVLNDNGRSYAPTVSKLSESLTSLRINRPTSPFASGYVVSSPTCRAWARPAYSASTASPRSVSEMVTPHTFFENLGVRYVGPSTATTSRPSKSRFQSCQEWDGPIVVHTLTQKGRGYRARGQR